MATWKIIVNSFLILVILAASIAVIADYRKHKDDENISPEALKELRRSHFTFAMLSDSSHDGLLHIFQTQDVGQRD